jgi:hypothetical protein
VLLVQLPTVHAADQLRSGHAHPLQSRVPERCHRRWRGQEQEQLQGQTQIPWLLSRQHGLQRRSRRPLGLLALVPAALRQSALVLRAVVLSAVQLSARVLQALVLSAGAAAGRCL